MKIAEEKKTQSKIKYLIQNATICMVTNNIHDWPLQVNALQNQFMDEDGNIWFLVFDSGEEAQFLEASGSMDVFYSNVKASEFLSLNGEAAVVDEHQILPLNNFPFHKKGNIETPYRVIRFIPQEAFCWDDQAKDMVPLLI